MTKQLLMLAVFWSSLGYSAMAVKSKNSHLDDCKKAWKKLSPFVEVPTHNGSSYAQMAESNNTVASLEKRVSVYESLALPDWDWEWVEDPTERDYLRFQNKTFLEGLKSKKHTIEDVTFLLVALSSQESTKNFQKLAFYALAAFKNPVAAEALMKFEDLLRPTALAGLDYSHDPKTGDRVVDFLFSLLSLDNSESDEAVLALAHLQSPKILPVLEKNMLLANYSHSVPANENVTWLALRGYINYKNPVAITVFQQVLKEPRTETQLSHAILGLNYFSLIGQLKGEERMKLFTLAVNSYIDSYRAQNGEALMNLVGLAPKECKATSDKITKNN